MMFAASMVSQGANSAEFLYKTHPKRAKYLAATFDDRGMPIPLIGQTGLVKTVGSKMAGYLSSMDIHEFYKIPALGGLTVAELPITALMAYFYIALIPGRIDSAIKRAPTMDNGKKDYREVGDVMTRDMLSIATFLFGLNILNASMLKAVQQQGHLAPFGLKPANEAKLQILGGGPSFWSRWPQLSLEDKVKKLRGEEQFAISHPDLKDQYFLANEGTLAHLVTNPINRKGIEPLFERERHGLHHFKGNAYLTQALDAMSDGFKQVVKTANELDTTLAQALQLPGSTQTTANGVQPATKAYWKALDPVREQLFGLPMLNRHTDVEALTLPEVRHAMAERVEHAKTTLDATLAKLEPKGNEALAKLLEQVRSGHGEALTDQLTDWARNNGERINLHLTQHLGLKKGTYEFSQSFDHYWNTLHNLEIQAPVFHARNHALEALTSDHQGPKVLDGVKALFKHSSQAMASLEKLEAVAAEAKVTRQSINPFKKPEWKPREFLADAAIKMRTPADWLALVFILAALGYFPVWFNETLTNYRFKHDHRPEPDNRASSVGAVMANNGPDKAKGLGMHFPALSVTAAPPLVPTPISATNGGGPYPLVTPLGEPTQPFSADPLPAVARPIASAMAIPSQASMSSWAPMMFNSGSSYRFDSLQPGKASAALCPTSPPSAKSALVAIPYPPGQSAPIVTANPFQIKPL
jgi:hypothetical protein